MEATKFKLKVLTGTPYSLSCQLYPQWAKTISTTEYEQEHDLLLLAQIHSFSDQEHHPLGQSSYFCLYQIDHEILKYNFVPMVIANDVSEDGKSHVSFIFQMRFSSIESVVLSCNISVIDSSDHEIYRQTYNTTPYKRDIVSGNTDFLVDKFLSREFLLKKSEELLPNDCLKLSISLNFQIKFLSDPMKNRFEVSDLWSSALIFNRNFQTEPKQNYMDMMSLDTQQITITASLLLDSEVGQSLCKKSKVLQAMAETEMLEKKERSIHIPYEHCSTLKLICEILMSTHDIAIKNFNEIYKMVILADYYDIEAIFEACRGMLKSFLYAEDDIVRNYAEMCLDNLLEHPEYEREILKKFIQSSLDIFKQELNEDGSDANEKNKRELEIKWICKFNENLKYPCYILSREIKFPEIRPNLDFYL